MSFILDALKKSEAERQQQEAADFATVPSGRDSPAAPRWLWILGLLLVINLVVVASFMLRPAPAPAPRPAAQEMPDPAPAAAITESPREPSFAERVADARRAQPAPVTDAGALPESRPDAGPTPAGTPAQAPGRTSPAAAPAGTARRGPAIASLPSLEELQVEGQVDLPPLHMDLHVYNEAAGRRFVSINMNKYHENERLREGPLVREITPEGVVLEYQGKAFALLQ